MLHVDTITYNNNNQETTTVQLGLNFKLLSTLIDSKQNVDTDFLLWTSKGQHSLLLWYEGKNVTKSNVSF